MGVGRPLSRASIPDFLPIGASSLRDAVGDVFSRFYDRNGEAVSFPGVERMISTSRFETVRSIPVTIAVAAGNEKILSLAVGAKAGYFSQLVTDVGTARGLLAHLSNGPTTGAPA